jgi:hypothetical protein
VILLEQYSFNVTSVVRNSVGDYTITWDTDFANANYPYTFGNLDGSVTLETISSKLVGSMRIETRTASATKIDRAFSLNVTGDQ